MFIEGHVTADGIKRMIAEQSDVAGIAVPGMLIGTPGMKSASIVDGIILEVYMLKQTCRLATTLMSLTLLLSPSAPVMTSTDTLDSNNAQTQVGQTGPALRCDTTPQRISFGPGSYAETVQPVLTPSCNQANYVVSTRANQLMVLVLTSPGAARFQITFPNGSGDGGPVGEGGVIFNKKLPSTGDYRIRISESTMADAWTGKVTLTVVIQ